MCPGHGINKNPHRPEVHESWVGIFDYPEEASLLTQHCAAAVSMAAASSDGILVFSGGDTREPAGRLSEGESYRAIAVAAKWWGVSEVERRTLVEGHARCSRDNLVYSIARFYEAVGNLPNRIVVVGWEFKRDRFLMHREAIRWRGAFSYVGINNPPAGAALEMALSGEARKREAMRHDPLLLGPKWAQQRRQRNPFMTVEPYSAAMPDFAPYLRYLNGPGEPVDPVWVVNQEISS
jgi:hypothetical protein